VRGRRQSPGASPTTTTGRFVIPQLLHLDVNEGDLSQRSIDSCQCEGNDGGMPTATFPLLDQDLALCCAPVIGGYRDVDDTLVELARAPTPT
jgi:hypothetical protein